jgi:endonuclease YncB( thermonuclease family)
MPLRLFLILIIVLSVSAGSAGPVYDGKVVGVSDGDTLIVLTPEKQQIKVRLAEIDARRSGNRSASGQNRAYPI